MEEYKNLPCCWHLPRWSLRLQNGVAVNSLSALLSIPACFIFFFLSHHADICIFYFKFPVWITAGEPARRAVLKVECTPVCTETYTDVTPISDLIQTWLFLTPCFPVTLRDRKQVSTETLSSKWTPISWFLPLSLPAFSISGPLFWGRGYLLIAPGRTMCPDLVPQCPKSGIDVSGSESPLSSTWRTAQNSTCTYFECIPQCECSDALNVYI